MILSKINILRLDADELINEFIINERLNELLIIVPTNRKIRYLKREFITLSPNQSVSKLNLHTFETFTREIFLETGFSKSRILSDATAAVLLNRSFKETKLKYFSNYKDEIPRGTLDKIKNVISEYKLNGITPSRLFSEADKLKSSEKLKAIDIANVYTNYLAACRQLSCYEVGDIYGEVLEQNETKFSEKFKSIFNGVNTVIVNGFDEFTQPEIDIINKVAQIENTRLFILFDYYRFNKNLFGHLDTCFEKLLAKGFREIEDVSTIYFRPYQSSIREKLFLLDPEDKQNRCDLNLFEIAAGNSENEIELIAKEIKGLILNENIDPADVAVGFNLISGHSGLVRDIFYKYGIPINLTDRFTLSESQPVIALINFLEILENNFYYKNIFRALTGKWINIAGIDLSNLQRAASNLRIISGYNIWSETLERVITEIRLDESDDDMFLPVWVYEKAKKDIEIIYGILKPFRSKMPVNIFKTCLFKLISDLRIPQSAINDQQDLIEKNVKAITVFIEMLKELFDLLILEFGSTKEFSLNFFLTQIKTAVQFTRYNIKERHTGGVLVTSVNELRGLNFDYVFIGGLIDGEFPTRYHPEIFYSGSYKKDEQKHILGDRYHFYQTLSCANKSLYLSYSLNDEKKENTPSTFINDFKRLFLVKSKSNPDYEALIYSKTELLKKISNSDTLKNSSVANVVIDQGKLQSDLMIDKNRIQDPFSATVYTGFLTNQLDQNEQEILLDQKNRQFSASQLEEYAKCPFQYFAKRILKLEIIDEPSEEIEALELGSIIHSILFDFYSELKVRKIVLSGCNDQTFKNVTELIFNIAKTKLDKLNITSESVFYEKEKILGVAGQKRNSILYWFLEEERKNSEDFIPEYFETEFGNFSKSADPETVDFRVGGVNVRGKIDRIDFNERSAQINVIDYKLGGKKPSAGDLQTGLSLQLPLYVYASKILIEAQLNRTLKTGSPFIYSLKLKKKEFGKKLIHLMGAKRNITEEELIQSNLELIDICLDFIPMYVDNISKGIFNLSQLKDRESKVCRFCDFKSICRIQDLA